MMSTMQQYMEQLVEDIRESARHKDRNIAFDIPPGLLKVPEGFEHFPVVLSQKAYQWFRLPLESFPPAEKWDKKQLLYMCVILRHLFEHYNIQVEIPNVLPYETVYAYLLKALNTDTTCEQDSENSISFCEGEEADCPFGDYCAAHDNGCDTWLNGHHWDGYLDWEEVKNEP